MLELERDGEPAAVGVGTNRSESRVLKKLLPGQPGTLRLVRRHGPSLVCVRYRTDASGKQRYTTVELVVDRAEIVRRPDRVVAVRVQFDEVDVQRTLRQNGARWDRPARVWRLPYRTATKLGLEGRIVEK